MTIVPRTSGTCACATGEARVSADADAKPHLRVVVFATRACMQAPADNAKVWRKQQRAQCHATAARRACFGVYPSGRKLLARTQNSRSPVGVGGNSSCSSGSCSCGIVCKDAHGHCADSQLNGVGVARVWYAPSACVSRPEQPHGANDECQAGVQRCRVQRMEPRPAGHKRSSKAMRLS
eukprot:4960647-Pleurochrysis_carterae.AAC.10